MSDVYASTVVARARPDSVTPQSEVIPGRQNDMVENRAGGVAFAVDCWTRLDRFLILGTDSQTYYADAREMTLSNVDGVIECLRTDGKRVVAEIVDVSMNGRASKNNAALFALALCTAYGIKGKKGVAVSAADPASQLTTFWDPKADEIRRAAFDALPSVARTATHLMQFLTYMEALRGWGKAAVRGVANWLLGHPSLELQAVKYRQREGWTLRDVLRLTHPKTDDADMRALFDWIAHRDLTEERIAAHAANENATPRKHDVQAGGVVIEAARSKFRLIDGYHAVQGLASETEVADLIREYSLPREAVPTEWLNTKAVWEALLVDMPMTALMRNLNKLTLTGVLDDPAALDHVLSRFRDREAIRRSRLHPFNILLAMRTYASGHGAGFSKLTWSPNSKVVQALNDAFYLAFSNVEVTGKRILQGIDVSGSMAQYKLANTNMSAREASTAMALVIDTVENNVRNVGFCSGNARPRFRIDASRDIKVEGAWVSDKRGYNALYPIDISGRRIDDAIRTISGLPMGGTDLAAPMLYALAMGLEIDLFVNYTDNETWSGDMHPAEALQLYRRKTGIPAKMVTVAMTATEYSVSDPMDAGSLDVVGFDTDAPSVIADFVRD